MRAGQHLVEDDTQSEDVGARVGTLATEDFRSHVDRRAAGDAALRERLGSGHGQGRIGAGNAARHAEVEQLDLAGGGEHDVLRLNVAVENAFGVGGCEGVDALKSDGEEAIERERGAQLVAQRGAGDELHDQQDIVLFFDNVVDGGDIGMNEGGGALAFAEEEVAVGSRIAVTAEHALDGNRALECGIEGAVNLAHAAGAEQGLDPEAADDAAQRFRAAASRRRLDRVGRIRHRTGSPFAKGWASSYQRQPGAGAGD